MDELTHAIERIYRERYAGFRNALATVTGSQESARDAVQEGFARALRERATFRGEGRLEAWIFRIALRTALESRRNGRELALEDVADPALPEPEHDPALTAAVRALPPRRRLVVFLRYFADLSYEEIAFVCGISEGTVAAALNQARAALLLELEGTEVRR